MYGRREKNPLTEDEQERRWRNGICTTEEPVIDNWCGTGPIESLPRYEQRYQTTTTKHRTGPRKCDDISAGVFGRRLDEKEQVAVQVHHYDVDLMGLLHERKEADPSTRFQNIHIDTDTSDTTETRTRMDSSNGTRKYDDCVKIDVIRRCNEEEEYSRIRGDEYTSKRVSHDFRRPSSKCVDEFDQETANALYQPLRQPRPCHVPEVIFSPTHVIHSSYPCIDPSNSPLLSMWDKLLLDAIQMTKKPTHAVERYAESNADDDISPSGSVKLEWSDIEDPEDCLPSFSPVSMREELSDILRVHYQHGMLTDVDGDAKVWPLAFARQSTSAVEHGVIHLARRCGPLEKKSKSSHEEIKQIGEIAEPEVIKQTAMLTRHSRPRRSTLKTGMAPTDLSKSITSETIWTQMSRKRRGTKTDSSKKTVETEVRPRSKSRTSSASKYQTVRPDGRPRWNSSVKVEECHPKRVS